LAGSGGGRVGTVVETTIEVVVLPSGRKRSRMLSG
jgi:hypothetical protein